MNERITAEEARKLSGPRAESAEFYVEDAYKAIRTACSLGYYEVRLASAFWSPPSPPTKWRRVKTLLHGNRCAEKSS